MEGRTEALARRRPSFFKVLLDYTQRLRLPPAFVKKYGECLADNVKLRSSSGEVWDVKMQMEISVENGEEVTISCFTGVGWRKFLNDWKLDLGEFLVLCYNGESTFEVMVFGTNGCERLFSAEAEDSDPDVTSFKPSSEGIKGKSPAPLQFPPRRGRGRPPKEPPKEPLKEEKSSDDDDDEENDPEYKDHSHHVPVVVYRRRDVGMAKPSYSGKLNPLYFEVVLKPHHLHKFTFRKKFIMAVGLKWAQSVELEYAGRCHSIKLDQRQGKATMAEGWREFLMKNWLVFEKKYSFEYKPKENVIHVMEVGNTGN